MGVIARPEPKQSRPFADPPRDSGRDCFVASRAPRNDTDASLAEVPTISTMRTIVVIPAYKEERMVGELKLNHAPTDVGHDVQCHEAVGEF